MSTETLEGPGEVVKGEDGAGALKRKTLLEASGGGSLHGRSPLK